MHHRNTQKQGTSETLKSQNTQRSFAEVNKEKPSSYRELMKSGHQRKSVIQEALDQAKNKKKESSPALINRAPPGLDNIEMHEVEEDLSQDVTPNTSDADEEASEAGSQTAKI